MEVHAHTHTERKKWIHYLWEFLMEKNKQIRLEAAKRTIEELENKS
jgi:hypothetical protein